MCQIPALRAATVNAGTDAPPSRSTSGDQSVRRCPNETHRKRERDESDRARMEGKETEGGEGKTVDTILKHD